MDLDVIKEVIELDIFTGARENAGIKTEIASSNASIRNCAPQRVSRRREIFADMSDYQEIDACQTLHTPCEMTPKLGPGVSSAGGEHWRNEWLG